MSVKVVLTPWVTHDGGAIYSLDVSPTEYKLATCGNGEGGDGCIVIWSLLPMMSEKHGRDIENHNPLLARIPMTGAVNSVRWSRCGKYFAAAADDKHQYINDSVDFNLPDSHKFVVNVCIMILSRRIFVINPPDRRIPTTITAHTVTIWEYSGRIKSAGTIGMRKEETNLEKYRCMHTLHGHAMEVLAVEWSWNGRFLASSSMDNIIIVWNALKFPERVVVLDASRDGHTGAVKGLSFDPVGKYLASQSQDKTLRIWNMENWTCETMISDPFEESAQSTMFMRPEWSPDGKMLVAPCAMNNGGPTAQLIQRGSWDLGRDLVGHRKAVTVVRCAPRCFEFEDSKGRASKISLYAVGSRDKTLSVWALPNLSRPLVVFFNFFKHSIMDATWKGTTLVCCSQDGTVKTLVFNEAAVGRMLRQQEMSDLCYNLYRTRLSQYTPAGDENGCTDGSNVENGVNGSASKSSFVETPADLIQSRMIVMPKNTVKEASDREREEAEIRAKAEAELVEKRREQIENRTKDGKRRIQPVFLCSTIDNSVPEKTEIPDDVMDIDKLDATFGTLKSGLLSPNGNSISKENLRTSGRMESTAESGSTTDSSSPSIRSDDDDDDNNEEDEVEVNVDEIEPGTRNKKRKVMGRDRLLMADFRHPVLRPLERLHKDSLALAAAELKPILQHPISGVKQGFIAVHNEWASSSGVKATKVVRLRCNEESSRQLTVEDIESMDNVLWTTFTATPVLLMAVNEKWAVLTCTDCSLLSLSTATGTVSFTLQLDSLPAQLGQQDSRIHVLTSNGYFSCWDLEERRALLTRIPVLDIVSNDVHLHSISLSPSGAPLISFTNGSTYSYSPNLQSWMPVDVWDGLSRLAGESFVQEDAEGGVIARTIMNKIRPGIAPTTSLTTRARVCQSKMEGYIFAALDGKSYDDLCSMVAKYTEMLIMDKATAKIREFCSMLNSWIERAKRKEKSDEWMDEQKMRQMYDTVYESLRSDAVLRNLLEDEDIVF